MRFDFTLFLENRQGVRDVGCVSFFARLSNFELEMLSRTLTVCARLKLRAPGVQKNETHPRRGKVFSKVSFADGYRM
jgi:hypothetical protein